MGCERLIYRYRLKSDEEIRSSRAQRAAALVDRVGGSSTADLSSALNKNTGIAIYGNKRNIK